MIPSKSKMFYIKALWPIFFSGQLVIFINYFHFSKEYIWLSVFILLWSLLIVLFKFSENIQNLFYKFKYKKIFLKYNYQLAQQKAVDELKKEIMNNTPKAFKNIKDETEIESLKHQEKVFLNNINLKLQQVKQLSSNPSFGEIQSIYKKIKNNNITQIDQMINQLQKNENLKFLAAQKANIITRANELKRKASSSYNHSFQIELLKNTHESSKIEQIKEAQ
ncbi:Uncharacterised protein [Mycoplasmopsis citelli]|uniref:Uncharacterized protein n=1 Tax=Mycoplasmopsis citelli TaxID=171281 RepID=A0A449B0R6_9BACT|nr:hypothetical protein [Mycoplasmopsis citelli]VEU74182.1 Uncharacterised protein [Mycoplasmopsis citelli]